MRGLIVLAAASVLLCPVLGMSGEFKPVKNVDELDWVVGTWKGKGPLMEETELGPPGTVTNATMNWHKRYDVRFWSTNRSTRPMAKSFGRHWSLRRSIQRRNA